MLTFLIRTAQAQVNIGDEFGPSQSFPTIGDLVNVLLKNILTIAGVIAFIAVVVAGFNMISHAGRGESEQASKDKGAFTAALIGLMIIFGAYFTIQIVSTIVGYDFLNPPIQ